MIITSVIHLTVINSLISGNVVEETQLIYNDWLSHVVRKYRNPKVEGYQIEWLIGPVPIK